MKLKKKKAGVNGWRVAMEAALVMGIIGFVVSGLKKTPHVTPPQPPPPVPVGVYTNQFMVGDDVYTNYVVKRGERCPSPDQPPSSEGEGTFSCWKNADDESKFDPEAQVHASKTWVAQFEPKEGVEETNSVPIPEPSSMDEVAATTPEPIHLVFTGRDEWRTELEVTVGDELAPETIPAAPDLSSNGFGFSHWRAQEEQAGEYDFGVVTTAMPREFVAVYTNLPIRIEYVVDGKVTRRDDWYTADPIPSPVRPKKEGFEFRGWLDELGWPWDPAYYKAHYVPVIRLTAKFEETGTWPTLTVVVEGKGVGLTNSAIVRFMKPSTREYVFTQTVECVSSKDTSTVIKADQYRAAAPDAQALMVTICDLQTNQVGTLVLLKLNGQDQKVIVPVRWTEGELKMADGLCNDLHSLFKKPKESWGKRIQDLLNGMPLFKDIGYDTFCKLYLKLPDPGLTPEEQKELKEYWPKGE